MNFLITWTLRYHEGLPVQKLLGALMKKQDFTQAHNHHQDWHCHLDISVFFRKQFWIQNPASCFE